MRKYLAIRDGKSANAYKDRHLTAEEKEVATKALVEAENEQPLSNRRTAGDASESGLIKFIQPINDLTSYRKQYPTFSFESEGKPVECLIPFSSEIKFNLFIRDMNHKVTNPTSKDDNLMVVMKGAPERILSRCSKIMINGEERDFDEHAKKEVNAANDELGRLGERVLAFATYKLEPEIYKKDPAYRFDVKGWKSWKDKSEYDPTIPGWFPMYNLTLVGLVSLNDPPRLKVDLSVKKCREAGIKVIMVTGDQPPTAAAIAHKVNIITDPTLEYNYLLNEEKLSHEDAWNKCQAIVIHGDLLAEKHA